MQASVTLSSECEFRTPPAGAYSYSYVTVGEFMAFVIGWNMVLEELIGTAACACALSACFDTLANRKISEALTNAFGEIDGKWMAFL